jgi:hypothetical protein
MNRYSPNQLYLNCAAASMFGGSIAGFGGATVSTVVAKLGVSSLKI